MHCDREAVLDFWFLPANDPAHGRPRAEWFRRSEAFDEAIRTRFMATVEAALAGELSAWETTPRGSLALLILLDQFTRNLFRGSARAFAGDRQAREIANAVIERGWDRDMAGVERVFVYLPFEHSEALADQARAIRLFTDLAGAMPDAAGFLDYARRHHEVIVRFGRFPHRNAALGRASTAAELAYLAEPGSGF